METESAGWTNDQKLTQKIQKSCANCSKIASSSFVGLVSQKECTCSMGLVQRCPKRISGPLMEQIDIRLEVQRVSFQKLAALDRGETAATIRRRVE